MQHTCHYVGGTAARDLLRRARPSLDRRHGGTPARGRLVHRRQTPHRCGKTPPRISTTYALCRQTPQTTYCYDGRTITYAGRRDVRPSCLTMRNRYTFVILRKAGTAAGTAGTRLAIRLRHERNGRQAGRQATNHRKDATHERDTNGIVHPAIQGGATAGTAVTGNAAHAVPGVRLAAYGRHTTSQKGRHEMSHTTKHSGDCKRVFGRYDMDCERCRQLAAGDKARPGWGDMRRKAEAQR